jgi:hypothetical protein
MRAVQMVRSPVARELRGADGADGRWTPLSLTIVMIFMMIDGVRSAQLAQPEPLH